MPEMERAAAGAMLTAEALLVLLLVALNGFFAMSELAILCARRARLQRRADSGSKGARIALLLADSPTRFLSTVQIGITLTGILAGAFGGATIANPVAARLVDAGVEERVAQPLSFGGVVVVLTCLSLVLGELVPKRIALIDPERIASAVAPTVVALSRAVHPIVSFLQICTEAIMRVFGVRSLARALVTDEEINALVEEGADQGSIDPAERHMVEQVLRLADRPVRTIMTRRRDIVWLDVLDTEETVRKRVVNNGYSRLLVCEKTLDDCLGYVRARTLVDGLLESAPLDLRSLVREPLREPRAQDAGAHGAISARAAAPRDRHRRVRDDARSRDAGRHHGSDRGTPAHRRHHTPSSRSTRRRFLARRCGNRGARLRARHRCRGARRWTSIHDPGTTRPRRRQAYPARRRSRGGARLAD